MVVIKNYITEDDGTTTVVIKGVELDNKTSLLLDNCYEVEADVRVVDPFKITDKQRRKIFALCNDIEAHTGQPRDYMRYMFMDYVEVLYGYEKRLSLSDGPSMRNHRITKPDFRPCSTCRSRSQAPFCLYTLRMISNHSEGTFGRLRYLLGGDRPSQTAHLTLSPTTISGAG